MEMSRNFHRDPCRCVGHNSFHRPATCSHGDQECCRCSVSHKPKCLVVQHSSREHLRTCPSFVLMKRDRENARSSSNAARGGCWNGAIRSALRDDHPIMPRTKKTVTWSDQIDACAPLSSKVEHIDPHPLQKKPSECRHTTEREQVQLYSQPCQQRMACVCSYHVVCVKPEQVEKQKKDT